MTEPDNGQQSTPEEGQTQGEERSLTSNLSEEELKDLEENLGGKFYTDEDLRKWGESFAGERASRAQQSKEQELLERYQQKYPNLQNLDEVDELLENYSAAEEEEKSESERVASERDRIAGERDTFASERDDYKGKYETLLKSQSLQNALIQKGVKPERMDMAIKNADLSNVELSEDGKVSGADKAAEELTKSVPEWFADTSRPGVPTSPDGQSGSNKLSDEEKRRMSGLDSMRL